MIVSFGLKLPRAGFVAAPAVMLGQSLVPVEEVQVGLVREIGVTADTHNPDQYLRCHQVQTKTRDRVFLHGPHLIRTRLCSRMNCCT